MDAGLKTLTAAARRQTDPLLVDVGQEQAVRPVQVGVQGVVPVLRLHQAGEHRKRSDSGSAGSVGPSSDHLLLLDDLGVGPGGQSFPDEVAHLGALSRTPGQPVHT